MVMLIINVREKNGMDFDSSIKIFHSFIAVIAMSAYTILTG